MTRTTFRTAAAGCLLLIAACTDSEKPPTNPGGGQTTGPVATIELTPSAPELFTAATLQLNATPKDAAGKPLAGRTVTWTTSAADVASVDANGVVRGVAAGTATITAAAEGKQAQTQVTVKRAPVASVTVTPTAPVLNIGDTLTLVASARNAQNAPLEGRQIRFSSGTPAIATVDSVTGVVRAVDSGEATITASSEGQSGTSKVTVRAPVATVAVGAAIDTLEAHESKQLQAVLRDGRDRVLTGRPVRWTSSNPSVATVDSVTGVLTGVDRGTVTVTATSEGKTGTVSRVVVIRYRSITTASEHACNIASGGIVWCWGVNGRDGRIGSDKLGDGEHTTTPFRLPTTLRFVQLTSYGRATCGIATDGRAYCWGHSGWGMLGNGSTANSTTPVAVNGGHAFKQLASGADHVCGVTTDGRAFCWGGNWGGQLGNGTSSASTSPVAAMPEMRFASITAGAEYTCGITTAGFTWCWGYNGVGNLGDGLKPSMGNTFTRTGTQVVGGHAFRQIMAGAGHTCGVTTDGGAYCWGTNGGKLGTGNTSETSTPSAVVGGHAFRSIATGHSATCGVTTSGDVYCWGSNANGQLGANVANGSSSPVRSAGTLKMADVAIANVATGSGSYACGTSDDRLTTYCWGRNNLGQLGNGGTTAVSVSNPTPSIVVGQKPL